MIELVETNHNKDWPCIPDNPFKFSIIGGLGSGKTNVLLNVIKHQRPDIDKIYLYVKDVFESKYQLLISGKEKVRNKKLENPKGFNEYWQTIDDVYEDLEDNYPIN